MKKHIRITAALVLVTAILASGCSSKKDAAGSDSSVVGGASSVSSGGSGGSDTGDASATGASSGDSGQGSSSGEIASESGGSSEAASDPGASSGDGSSSGAGSTESGSDSGDTSGSGGSGGSNGSDSSAVTSGFSFTWNANNSWEESGKKCGTVELIIKNDSKSAVSSWTIGFAVPDGFEITNGWNGVYSVDGTTATVSNVDYNGEIPIGGNVSIGFNYSAPDAFAPPSDVTIKGTPGSASGGGNNGGGNSGSGGNQGGDQNKPDAPPSDDVKELLKRSDKAVQGDDWLHTDGRRILDSSGKQVWLTGVNWFGYNTGTNTFDGLWNSQMRASVKGIADHGFNLIRVPISAELLNQWSNGQYPNANYNQASNPEMNSMNSLQIFDYFLKLAEENGLKVMPDIHCAETNAMGHNVNL